ncbi:Protein F19G12.2 [Aphelenchoides avenae]|nr:Protein F19G12.2 [Aphelenchus avenae]
MKLVYEDADRTLKPPEAGAKVASIQGIGATFIQNVKVKLNGREVFNSNSLYAYKAYLDTELTYSGEVKKSYLSCAGWYPDGKSQTSGSAVESRASLLSKGEPVQFLSRLYIDLFNQERYLINGVDIEIEVTPHKSNFSLINLGDADAKSYRLLVTSCKMYVKTLNVMDGLSVSITDKLQTTAARYPYRKAELKSTFISAGTYEVNKMMFTDNLPSWAAVAFVAASSYMGDQKSSPFDFKPFGVREISLNANGENYPNIAYDLSWSGNKFCRAFHDMHEGSGLGSDSNGISMDKYASGWTVFVFNLSDSDDNSSTFDLVRTGSTSVNVKFSEPVPSGGIYMIVYGERHSLLLLDSNRTVSTDLTA